MTVSRHQSREDRVIYHEVSITTVSTVGGGMLRLHRGYRLGLTNGDGRRTHLLTLPRTRVELTAAPALLSVDCHSSGLVLINSRPLAEAVPPVCASPSLARCRHGRGHAVRGWRLGRGGAPSVSLHGTSWRAITTGVRDATSRAWVGARRVAAGGRLSVIR